jgi:dihydrofolate synthase/folylpolyglutamate synthase
LFARAPASAEVWLDGAHNEAGGRALSEAMADFEDASPRPLALICGTLTTKDTAGFLSHFKGLARQLIAVPIAGDHAGRSADEVARIASSVGLDARATESVGAALDLLAAEDWPRPPRVLITGSLYLAGEVLEANGNAPT